MNKTDRAVLEKGIAIIRAKAAEDSDPELVQAVEAGVIVVNELVALNGTLERIAKALEIIAAPSARM